MIGRLEKSKGKFNYFTYALFMYLKLYVPVLGSILMFIIFPLTGDGPFWYEGSRYYSDSCVQFFWPNILTYNFYAIEMEDYAKAAMVSEFPTKILKILNINLKKGIFSGV